MLKGIGAAGGYGLLIALVAAILFCILMSSGGGSIDDARDAYHQQRLREEARAARRAASNPFELRIVLTMMAVFFIGLWALAKHDERRGVPSGDEVSAVPSLQAKSPIRSRTAAASIPAPSSQDREAPTSAASISPDVSGNRDVARNEGDNEYERQQDKLNAQLACRDAFRQTHPPSTAICTKQGRFRTYRFINSSGYMYQQDFATAKKACQNVFAQNDTQVGDQCRHQGRYKSYLFEAAD